MFTRRKFLTSAAKGSVAAAFAGTTIPACSNTSPAETIKNSNSLPIVISTWNFGKEANEEAWKVLSTGGSSLDAVEQGVRQTEADPTNQSVGYGGLPDRDGRVALDACIMDWNGNAGSVSAIEHIMHPISVARKVMENTPHVMLVGTGAYEFALTQGFVKENLLTEKSKKDWEAWKKTSKYEPKINSEMHDTIGMLAIDKAGKLSGACTTSGLAFKMRGRVGDSPVIGAGMYADNEVGGAAATGLGESILKILGSFLVVELMRQGLSPLAACEEAVARIVKKQPNHKEFQVAFIAINKAGEVGAFSLQPGFMYALKTAETVSVTDANSFYKK